MLLSGLSVAIFVESLILGGSPKTRQVHRNIGDPRPKSTFVSKRSDELKTPLTTISMYVPQRTKVELDRRRSRLVTMVHGVGYRYEIQWCGTVDSYFGRDP